MPTVRLFIFRNKEDQQVFIKLLEFGESQGLQGVSDTLLRQWAEDNGIFSSLENTREEWPRLFRLYKECFDNETTAKNEKVLKTEYYFRLIEYRELKEARQTALQANRNSWIAIFISLLAIGITSYFTWTQINTSIKLHDETIQQLTTELKQK